MSRPRHSEGALCAEQFLDELVSPAEQHRVALLDERVADRAGGVALAHPGQTEGQQFDGALRELAGC